MLFYFMFWIFCNINSDSIFLFYSNIILTVFLKTYMIVELRKLYSSGKELFLLYWLRAGPASSTTGTTITTLRAFSFCSLVCLFLYTPPQRPFCFFLLISFD